MKPLENRMSKSGDEEKQVLLFPAFVEEDLKQGDLVIFDLHTSTVRKMHLFDLDILGQTTLNKIKEQICGTTN